MCANVFNTVYDMIKQYSFTSSASVEYACIKTMMNMYRANIKINAMLFLSANKTALTRIILTELLLARLV